MAIGAKILVIDDEEDLRENLKYILEMKGHEVRLAGDGVQGLKMLETYSPDLIILDLNMPNMGGIEFYQRICDKDMPRYPVFVLTARANMEKFFKDFNVDGFMAKPFEIPDLLNEIGIVIEKRKGLAKEKAASRQEVKKVFIVENDEAFSAKIGSALLRQGLTVNLARTGAEGLERMSRDVPDVACIKLSPGDMTGELVILKLKRLAKTSGVKCILYAYAVAEQEIITGKIKQKAGIDEFVIVETEKDLVDAINAL
jgi:DNA-binding response OmpR family regulator